MLSSKKNTSSTLTLQSRLCCTFPSAGSLETGKFILIYLFKLKILAVTSEVYVYYQLQCTCHSFGWNGSQGRIKKNSNNPRNFSISNVIGFFVLN